MKGSGQGVMRSEHVEEKKWVCICTESPGDFGLSLASWLSKKKV